MVDHSETKTCGAFERTGRWKVFTTAVACRRTTLFADVEVMDFSFLPENACAQAAASVEGREGNNFCRAETIL